jgi:DNA-binding LacI/PurR family transcriptional regulator
VVAEARVHGYTVVIDQTDGEPDRERELIMRGASAALFDGVILSPLSLSPADLSRRDHGGPLVLLGERIAESPYDHVAIDNVAAATEATEHLLDLGRTRIAAMGDQPYDTGETAQLRTRGYRRAHAARGVPVDESLVVRTDRFHRTDGAAAMARLLDHPDGPPDAVFCYNDLLALGAIRTLLTRGLRVPEDVAVVGFDDTEAGRYNTPTLTTVSPDKATIARLAVDRLVARLATSSGPAPAPAPAELRVPHRLAIRESTVGPPDPRGDVNSSRPA